MQNYPLISVIIPVYNVEGYLHYCIESILKQTYHNIEVLLINDGSKDNSGVICQTYANTDKRIHIITQNNSGISATRNNGLKMAKGDFIIFIDADDYIHPMTLEIMYKALNEDNYDFSMILGQRTYHHNIEPIKIPSNIEKKTMDRNYLMKGLFNLTKEDELQYQVVWNKLYKKEILKDLFFRKTGSEDTEFNSRVYLKCKKAVLINLYLYNWVQRPTSITHQPINENYIDNMNSYYIALNNISKEDKGLRAYCLEKLYKIMINIRYHANKTKYKHIVIKNIHNIKENTFNEFLYNNNINIFRRFILIIFLKQPPLYSLFLKVMELKAKL